MNKSDVAAILTLAGIILIPLIVGMFSRSAWQSVFWAFVLVLLHSSRTTMFSRPLISHCQKCQPIWRPSWSS